MTKMAGLVLICLILGGCDTLRQYTGGAGPRFIVFFASRSTELPPDGRTIVKNAAAKIERTHPASVLIAASATSSNNTELSEPRFAVVRQALIDNGVSQDLIARSTLSGGKLAGNSVTGDQRVEITLLANKP
jgi:outer membrane protein OmpA-like peptidoglycan-associated protein